MFPSSNRTAVPPMPPDIQAQQQAPPSTAAMFGQMGGAIPDPVSVLEAQVNKLEQWAADTAPLANQVNPALTTLLVPIAQAGKALQAEIANLKQRNSGPSQPVTGTDVPNLPGNIPGGRPAM